MSSLAALTTITWSPASTCGGRVGVDDVPRALDVAGLGAVCTHRKEKVTPVRGNPDNRVGTGNLRRGRRLRRPPLQSRACDGGRRRLCRPLPQKPELATATKQEQQGGTA